MLPLRCRILHASQTKSGVIVSKSDLQLDVVVLIVACLFVAVPVAQQSYVSPGTQLHHLRDI
jgi:hypothetical protein